MRRMSVRAVEELEHLVAYSDVKGVCEVYLSPEGRDALTGFIAKDQKDNGKEYKEWEKERKRTHGPAEKKNLSDSFTNCCRALKNSTNGIFRCAYGFGKPFRSGLFEMEIDAKRNSYRWCYFKKGNMYVIINGFEKRGQKEQDEYRKADGLMLKYGKMSEEQIKKVCRIQ